MNINSSGMRIAALTREIETKWNNTKEYWSDQKSKEFEQKYLQELFSSVNVVVAATQELAKMMEKVRKDCE